MVVGGNVVVKSRIFYIRHAREGAGDYIVDIVEADIVAQERGHGDFIGRIYNAGRVAFFLKGIVRESEAREFCHIGAFECQSGVVFD